MFLDCRCRVRWGVLAERLASQSGKKILIIDTRAHIGGNAYDHYDAAGPCPQVRSPHLSHQLREVWIPRTSPVAVLRAPRLASVDGQLLPSLSTSTPPPLWAESDLVPGWGVLRFCCWAERYIRTSEDVVVSRWSGTVRSSSVTTHASNGASTRLNSTSQLPPAFPPTRTVMGGDTYQAMPLYGYTMFEKMLSPRSKSCLTLIIARWGWSRTGRWFTQVLWMNSSITAMASYLTAPWSSSMRRTTRLCINQWQSWTIRTSIYTPASPSSNTYRTGAYKN